MFGFGTVLHKFTATNSFLFYVLALSYHLSSADICPFSHQTYHQLSCGSSELDDDRIVLHLKRQPYITIWHDTKISINHHHSNLPIKANTACIKKELILVVPCFKSAMASSNNHSIFTDHWNIEFDKHEYEFDCYFNMCCWCVGSDKSINITNAHKEILLWHLK